MSLRALAARAASAAATALSLGVLCGVALVSEPEPPSLDALERAGARPVPPPPAPAPAPAVEAPAEEPSAVAPVASAAPPATPADLARALPDPTSQARLAALLAGPAPEVAVEVAQALAAAPSPEGRALLVARLAELVDAPGPDHVACLEALAAIGQAADLEVVLPWARRTDEVGVVAAWCVRSICARAGLEPPEDLREVEAPASDRVGA